MMKKSYMIIQTQASVHRRGILLKFEKKIKSYFFAFSKPKYIFTKNSLCGRIQKHWALDLALGLTKLLIHIIVLHSKIKSFSINNNVFLIIEKFISKNRYSPAGNYEGRFSENVLRPIDDSKVEQIFSN
jgi:hypothetical protein